MIFGKYALRVEEAGEGGAGSKMNLLSYWAVYQNSPSNLVVQVALNLSCHSGNLGLVRRDSCSCLSLRKKKIYSFSAEELK